MKISPTFLKTILKLVSEGWIIIFANMDDLKKEMDSKQNSGKNYYLATIRRIINSKTPWNCLYSKCVCFMLYFTVNVSVLCYFEWENCLMEEWCLPAGRMYLELRTSVLSHQFSELS